MLIGTTGAGDNFAAAFIAGILEEKSLVECAAQANAGKVTIIAKQGRDYLPTLAGLSPASAP